MTDDDKIACCNHCKRTIIEIDNRGERLTGCLTCNLWSAPGAKRWTRLSEEDLRALHQLRHGGHNRAPAEASALRILTKRREAYIFSEHFLAVSSHAPPALSQLALSVAFVTSPAKAGPVKASARAKAIVETSVFMTFLPYACTRGALNNANLVILVPAAKALKRRGPNGTGLSRPALFLIPH